MLQMIPLRALAGSLLLLMISTVSLKAQSSPVVITNYQTGTDSAYLNASQTGIASPSLIVYPKVAFLGGNNCAIMAVTSHSAYTQGTPTDNMGETWQAGPSVTSSANNYTLKIWYVLGDTAGTNAITIPMTGAPSSSPANRMGVWLTEVQNCNTSSIGGTGTLNTAATGSQLTLTLSAAPTSGDMVWAAFIDTFFDVNNVSPTPFDSSISQGSGFTFLSKSLSFGKAAEYSTSSTSTSIPVTYSGSNTILGVAVVIKQGSLGNGPPSGTYIDHYQVEQFNGNNQVSFPCAGNLIVGMVNTNNQFVSSVSGSTGTWATPASALTTSNGQTAQVFYGYGASCVPTTTFTPTWNSTPQYPGTEIAFASVKNALNTSSVFDGGHTSLGNQSTATNLTADSITPAHANDIVFNMTTIALHSLSGTVTDANNHRPTWLGAVNTKNDDNTSCANDTNNSTLDEDNGNSFFVNPDTTTLTFIYTGLQVTGPCTGNPVGVGAWSSASAAFITAGTGAAVPPNPPTNLRAVVN
jgi:hypothetical protein